MRVSSRQIIYCFFFLLLSLPSHAQKQGQQLIDSLLKELPTLKYDTGRARVLAKLSSTYSYINADEGIKYGTQALTIASQKKWKSGISLANNDLGKNYLAKSDYPKAMDHFIKALSINEELNDSEGIGKNSVNIGIVYYNQGDSKKALDYYLKALPYSKTSKEKKEFAANLVDIGVLYSSDGEYSKAMEYYQKALAINEAINNKDGIGGIYENIGQDYLDQKKFHEALKYCLRSLSIYEGLGNKDGVAANLGAIGATYLGVATNFNASPEGDTLIKPDKESNLKKAIEYLNKGVAICNETSNLSYLLDFSRELSYAYEELGDCHAALSNLRLYLKLRDTVVFSGENKIKIADLEQQHEKELSERVSKLETLKRRNELLVTLGAFAVLVGIIWLIAGNNRRVRREKDRSEELLLNILPAKVAEELKATGKAEARYFEPVTVIFTDFVNFTIAAEKMTPHELISELDLCFKTFDQIVGKYGIEKIKTSGDAYMAVCGLPVSNKDHAVNIVRAAMDIRSFMAERKRELGDRTFEVRIGVHTGGVIAGIVGAKKYAYDIWGDTVNTAARMEQHGEPGKINISQTTYDLVKNTFECLHRGEIDAKNKGSLNMYFVK